MPWCGTQGQKMSKSQGNVIDPLEMIDEYGTDAFRFTLAAFAAQGRDIRLSEERICRLPEFRQQDLERVPFTLINLAGIRPREARRTRRDLTLADNGFSAG